MTSYLGFDVLEVDPNWNDGIQTDYSRPSLRLDPGTGRVFSEDKSGIATVSNGFSWFMPDRASIVAFKAFVAARRGAAVPFWFPTWRQDLQLYSDALSSDLNLNIHYIGFSKFLFPNPARRFLAFRFADGSLRYRKITAATDTGNGLFETITLDSSLGVAVPSSTMIFFLLLCRLSEDRVVMNWQALNMGTADLVFQEVGKETP